MKRLVLFLFSFLYLQFSVFCQQKSNFQQKEISLNFQEITLGEALLQIAATASFNLSFNPDILPVDSVLSISFTQQTSKKAFKSLLPKNIEINEFGNSVILQKKKQNKKINFELNGTVIDAVTKQAIHDALLVEVSGLASELSSSKGTFKFNIQTFNKTVGISVNKDNYHDTLILIDVKTDQIQIELRPIRLNSKKIPLEKIPRKGYEMNAVPYVLVPKSVQNRTDKLPFQLYRDYQFSLLPGIGTNLKMSGLVENKYSFNLVGGYNYGISELEFGSAFNINRRNVEKVQFAGGFNLTGGEVKGVQLAGGFNITRGEQTGLQGAGGFNITGGDYAGVQLAGGYNFTRGNQEGTQIAGGFNVALKNFKGVQIAAGFNQSLNLKGSQISAGINLTIDTLIGVQVAPVNYSKYLSGQQIGILNIADTSTGIQIGLINVVRKGAYLTTEFSSDELLYANLALKMGVKELYNIYTAGFNHRGTHFLWSYGFGVGKEKTTAKARIINYELTGHWLFEEIEEDQFNFGLLKWQFSMQKKLSKNLFLAFGPSLNLLFYENHIINEANYQSLSPYSIYDLEVNSINMNTWVGFKLAIGFKKI